ncbi:hypothetical protein FRC00_014096 [Tulasnella sp. 408]|nr:hypothetical protein FRC00_014096 [Tulasnella sp. 408]
MTTQHSLTLGFAFLSALGATALPSLGPTRTTPLCRTFALTTRAESSSTTTAPKGTLRKPVEAAVTVVTVVLFFAMFGLLIAKQYGIQFHCDHVKKALGRRSRGQKPAPLSPPSTTLPTLDHHGVSAGAPTAG